MDNVDPQLQECTPEALAGRFLSQPPPPGWRPSGMTRAAYLDIVERVVRHALPWVDAGGAVIDPVLHREHAQTSPRFASSCAVLLHFGRGLEMRETLFKVMDHCCEGLRRADSVERSPDFWMRELATAYICLEGIAPEERRARWARELSEVVPERNYKCASPLPGRRRSFHNWAIYAAAGESMREAAGIGGPSDALWGRRFFDAYVRQQLWRFNEFGMYQDPGDPITYDIATRLQLETALATGYDGVWRGGLRQILDDAMFPTLLFMSPTGHVPFGGRSSQFYFEEGIVCALCELAAARRKDDDPRLAGAFKRQAHLSAQAVFPGLLRADGRLFHVKNRFPPETRHGCDSYGHYSVYSLFAASVFALAAWFADDAIPEAPAVSEMGGYAFGLPDNFHKFFCNFNGAFLEFDLRPNPLHDACGLGRILLPGLPWGLLPVLPFAQEPVYTIAPELPKNRCPSAVAPEWFDAAGTLRRLAASDGPPGAFSQIAPGVWQVRYEAWGAQATYTADLRTQGQLALDVRLDGDAVSPALIIPVLRFDGENRPTLELDGASFTADMQDCTLRVTSDGEGACLDGPAVNRTGLYERIRIPFCGAAIHIVMRAMAGE